jgi:hypothetical protein
MIGPSIDIIDFGASLLANSVDRFQLRSTHFELDQDFQGKRSKEQPVHEA